MSIEIKVPSVGESITEVTVARWMKAQGEQVALNESIAELETDKVTLEVPAPEAGILSKIVVPEGQTAPIGAVLGVLTPTGDGSKPDVGKPGISKSEAGESGRLAADFRAADLSLGLPLTPAVRKLVEEHQLDPAAIEFSGKGGRLTKEDVIRHMAGEAGRVALSSPNSPAPDSSAPDSSAGLGRTHVSKCREERVPFTRLRLRIAERLKQAQNTAAILTTFNEVDMSELMALRERYRGQFEKTHGVRLGLVSLFVKASVSALCKFPIVNAAIDGREIVYKNYYDIGVAVGSDRGLVVPVLRGAEHMSLADIERGIADFGKKTREGRLTLGELAGGTFTISNGGVYGSLLSTPILNPPQSGILGLHKIQDRPVAIAGKVEIRKMMFIALSYDHRIIDGKEAVSFLVHMKECIEEPQRMLLDL